MAAVNPLWIQIRSLYSDIVRVISLRIIVIKTAEQRTIIQQYGDWYTGRQRVGCYIWYSEEGPGQAAAPPRPLLAVPAHPSTVDVPTSYHSMWHYNCLCTLNG